MKEIVFQSKEQNVPEKLHIGVNCNIKESCRCAGKKNQKKSQSGFIYHADKVSMNDDKVINSVSSSPPPPPPCVCACVLRQRNVGREYIPKVWGQHTK